MSPYPARLAELVDIFESLPDRAARIETLLGVADRFQGVPETVATRPYPEENRVKECESQAYVWARPAAGGSLRFYFAVDNPQGISVMATAVIIDETLSGAPLAEVATVDPEFVYALFGRELSMGKSMGLMGIVNRVKALAAAALES